MQFHYSTDTKDLRAAMYYGVLMRNAAFGRIMLVLLPLALLYFFGVTCGLWPDIPAISYVVLACGIWVLILLSVWQFGSSMLIFLSAMKQIPQELYEAARVDGAGPVKQFFTITLPLLTSTIFFNLIMQMINGMLVFAQGQIITAGKPMDSTLFYVLYLYNQAFKFNNMGYASAMGWIMIAIIAILTGILFGTKKLWVYEGGY